MIHNYPEHILKLLREAEGIEDTSRDHLLQKMSPISVLEVALRDEGIIGYAYTIMDMVKDIFGVDLYEV